MQIAKFIPDMFDELEILERKVEHDDDDDDRYDRDSVEDQSDIISYALEEAEVRIFEGTVGNGLVTNWLSFLNDLEFHFKDLINVVNDSRNSFCTKLVLLKSYEHEDIGQLLETISQQMKITENTFLGADLHQLYRKSKKIASYKSLAAKWRSPMFEAIMKNEYVSNLSKTYQIELESEAVTRTRVEILVKDQKKNGAKSLLKVHYDHGNMEKDFFDILLKEEDYETIIDEMSRKSYQRYWYMDGILQKLKNIATEKVQVGYILAEKFLMTQFLKSPKANCSDLLKYAGDHQANTILDHVIDRFNMKTNGDINLKDFLKSFSEKFGSNHPESVEKIRKLVLSAYQNDPSCYCQSLFDYCEIDQIENVSALLQFTISDLPFPKAMLVLTTFVERGIPLSKKVRNIVITCIPNIISRADVDLDKVCSIIKSICWYEADNDAVTEIVMKFLNRAEDFLKQQQFFQLFMQIFELRRKGPAFEILMTNFLYQVHSFLDKHVRELATQTTTSNLTRQLPTGLIVAPDGCSGCKLLEYFLANPNKRQENITVNGNCRKCVLK